MLYSLHLMGANILAVKELQIDKAEAEKLSEAIQKVAEHYDIGLDPKKAAIFNLCAVAGSIYVPRVIAVVVSHRAAKPAQVNSAPQATPIRPARPEPVRPSGTHLPENLSGTSPSQLFDMAN